MPGRNDPCSALFLTHLRGEANRRWTLDDFALTQHQPREGESEPVVNQGRLNVLPDKATLDRYLVDLVTLFNARPHRMAALFEMIPAWLRFLETRGLIDAEQHAQTLDELRPLAGGLVKFWQNFNSEPAPRLAAERWPMRD